MTFFGFWYSWAYQKSEKISERDHAATGQISRSEDIHILKKFDSSRTIHTL
jgi:hypothetical protein